MTLLMALHHTHDEFDTFLDATRATLFPGTLYLLFSANKKPYFIRVAAFFVM